MLVQRPLCQVPSQLPGLNYRKKTHCPQGTYKPVAGPVVSGRVEKRGATSGRGGPVCLSVGFRSRPSLSGAQLSPWWASALPASRCPSLRDASDSRTPRSWPRAPRGPAPATAPASGRAPSRLAGCRGRASRRLTGCGRPPRLVHGETERARTGTASRGTGTRRSGSAGCRLLRGVALASSVPPANSSPACPLLTSPLLSIYLKSSFCDS